MLKGGAQRVSLEDRPFTDTKRVQVVLRVRPFLPHEANKKSCLQINGNQVEVMNPRNNLETIKYSFDHCYSSDAPQDRIFNTSIHPLMQNIVKGQNTTVFAYGNTGAGKTFTMVGSGSNPGIIPNLMKQLFKTFNTTYKTRFSFKVSLSYLEIYKEKVYDLLNPSELDLPIREDQKKNIFIPGLKMSHLSCFEDFERQFALGNKNRSTASTKLNTASSRSHAIIQLSIDCTNILNGSCTTSKFHLIDLAGSEDNRKTDNVGIRLEESGAINKSLFVLGQVVDALNNNLNRIPYRDSKLTRILQDSLGGKSVALMIANVAPCEEFFIETVNTLNFASKSRLIENRVLPQDYQPSDREIKLKAWKEQKETKSIRATTDKRWSEGEESSSQKRKLSSETDSSLSKKRISDGVSATDKSEITKRIELLEKQILKNTSFEPVDTQHDIIGYLSPVTREKNGKAFIQRAKSLEANGKYKDAIRDYEMAIKCNGQDSALSMHIKKLQCLIDEAADEDDQSLYVADSDDEKENAILNGKSKKKAKSSESAIDKIFSIFKKKEDISEPPNPEIRARIEADILNVLNKGNLKEIKSLKGIGDARAQKIIEFLMSKGKFECLSQLEDLGLSRKVIDAIINSRIS